ncbi:MAG: hypothetical protein V2J24_02375 [Pseudomonadales bacterium]|jgi:hypothetical protein|nr:hypothetical protein [Pseudomonadales bacterium]
MIWFERFRQLLATDTGRAFRLLIAELVVVVLGILIAFRVEEWRDYRIDREEARASMEAIVEDLVLGDEELALWHEVLVTRTATFGSTLTNLPASRPRERPGHSTHMSGPAHP